MNSEVGREVSAGCSGIFCSRFKMNSGWRGSFQSSSSYSRAWTSGTGSAKAGLPRHPHNFRPMRAEEAIWPLSAASGGMPSTLVYLNYPCRLVGSKIYVGVGVKQAVLSSGRKNTVSQIGTLLFARHLTPKKRVSPQRPR